MTQKGGIGSPVWVPSLRPMPTITSFAWKGNWPGPPDGHSMMTTLNCAASTHRSPEGVGSHRTTGSTSTPGVAHERVLGDVEHRCWSGDRAGFRVLMLVAAPAIWRRYMALPSVRRMTVGRPESRRSGVILLSIPAFFGRKELGVMHRVGAQ